MSITAQQAKDISLEVWRYFAEHPEIHSKEDLPAALFSKIKDFKMECPLCELFLEKEYYLCSTCPLVSCFEDYSLYPNYCNAINLANKKYYAEKIVKTIEAWNPDKA